MPACLKINYTHFLFKNEADAAKILMLLGKGLRVDYDYFAGKEVYFPHEDPCKIELSMVNSDQIKARDPKMEMKHSGPLLLKA